MSRATVSAPPAPCIWMSAGLVTYKYCDRGMDCEHCPLDLALRGVDAGEVSDDRSPRGPGRAVEFPDDRMYTRGHTWLQRADSERADAFRFGIDAFAAVLLDRVREFRWDGARRRAAAGASLGELEVGNGALALHAPFGARIRRENPDLADDNRLPLREPYGGGWLLELAPTRRPGEAGLLAAAAARDQAAMDLRHFRRRIAMEMLAGSDDLGPTLADGGEPLTDVRRILGADRYLRLLRELIG